MGYLIRTRTAEGVAGLDPTVYTLVGPHGDEAEVCPALGFNVFRWRATAGGTAAECLYADPQFLAGAPPTRSGIPVLFPFPNRIRDGRFAWAGKEYSLPPNDPAMRNAIHGFACRAAWRVTGAGADPDSAWVTGTYRGSVDGGWTRDLWPADHELRLTVRLSRGALRLEAVVHNPDTVGLPFGLGYHPYFLAGDDTQVEVPAGRFWLLTDNLPSGGTPEVDASRDLNRPRQLGGLQL